MKIYVMTDLEGVCGVNGRKGDSGIGNKIINEDAAKRELTDEVNAVAEGLAEAGADEILVVDGHGGGNSIQIERLCPLVTLEQSGGGLAPVNSVDADCAAALHIGAHAMMGVSDGFLNHTFNSHSIVGMWLNGVAIGEIASEALLCAYFGVPTILVSGDRAACREAAEFLGRIDTVETKIGASRYLARNRPPALVKDELRRAAKMALLARASFPIKKIAPPYELVIRTMCPNQADAYEQRGAKRLDAFAIKLESDDFLDLCAQRRGWAPGVHAARIVKR